jgi:hypothetical protein
MSVPISLTGVTAHKTSDGRTVYTISADGPLNRAQTWQDGSGQHIVLYKGNAGAVVRGQLPAGVRVGQVSESLEIVLPANERQRIVVQPRLNQIDVVVSGGGGEIAKERNVVETTRERRLREAPRQSNEVATKEKSAMRSFVPMANRSIGNQRLPEKPFVAKSGEAKVFSAPAADQLLSVKQPVNLPWAGRRSPPPRPQLLMQLLLLPIPQLIPLLLPSQHRQPITPHPRR